MSTKNGTASKVTKKIPVQCVNGPWRDRILYLQEDRCTAIFSYRGETGRYVGGKWEAA